MKKLIFTIALIGCLNSAQAYSGSDQKELEKFKVSIGYSEQANKLLENEISREISNATLNMDSLRQFFRNNQNYCSLTQKALATAKDISPASLNNIYPGFGEEFQASNLPMLEADAKQCANGLSREEEANNAHARAVLTRRWKDYLLSEPGLKTALQRSGVF